MAEREGFEPAAFVLPKILANFRSYYQRYQSLATVARMHFTSILGKSNRRHFGSNGSHVCANLRILGCTRKIILGTQELQWCREGEFLEPDVQPVDSMVNLDFNLIW